MKPVKHVCLVGSIISLTAMLFACHSAPPVPVTEVSASGETVIHASTSPAIQIGDNRGNIADIKDVDKAFYGSEFVAEFVLAAAPAEAMGLHINASSVTTGGAFVCISTIYITEQEVGRVSNGDTRFPLDPAMLKPGENVLTIVSESCTPAGGGYTTGIDDILIHSIKLTAA